jgi:outer membrane protein assembly factor BamB
MRRRRIARPLVEGGPILGAALAAAAANCAALGSDWPQFARLPQRTSLADGEFPGLAAPLWVRGDAGGAPITFKGQAGVVAQAGRVFATGRVGVQARALAFSAGGELLWSENIPSAHLESWSTPALDVRNGAIIIASGAFITAMDASTGAWRWQAPLMRPVVNASPLVTSDLGAANRIFITDYDPFGGSARLYCINADHFDPALNPWQPGEIIWSVIIGAASGSTPAYHEGIVYVATVSDESGASAGQVRAYAAAPAAAPEPLWIFTNPVARGFFGGLAVRSAGGSVWLYAATYGLYGGQFAGNLVKIDGSTGQLAWSEPCNRTDATPIPLADGRIAVSGGIHGFGSLPSVQLFADHGTSAALLWDSALDSWQDHNNNGTMDPGEYLVVGGWTHQPAASSAAGTRLLAGAIPALTFGACTDLYLLDLERHPQDPGFIVSHFGGAGSTPAIAQGTIFTLGAAGLHALAEAPGCWANCDSSTVVPILNVEDFTCFINAFAQGGLLPPLEQVAHYANCDRSTAPPVLNVEDFTCFINRFAAGCP